jgi:glycosyltransferase involved in cell wall biosynthesis
VKILLDARKIGDYGIGVYIQNLFQGIVDRRAFVCRAIHLKGTYSLELPKESTVEVTAKNYDFREHAEIPLKTRKYKDYWYFSPHYVYPLFVSQKLIITVHDLIHFKFPQLFKPAMRVEVGKFFMRQVQKKAALVFAVSQTTKNDLMDMFRFHESRVKVIHNGIAEIFFQQEKHPSILDFPYVLYTGNLKPHKNLAVLIKAFSLIKDRFPDFRLVLAGVDPDRAFRQSVADLGVAERVVTKGYLDQKDLIRFIDGAEFFIFPSLYEGFGFPPLEAMARKKAVISSPGGSLKEILGDNALFFAPDSAEELAEKITLFIENDRAKKEYETKGFAHCQKFRWEKTIGEYISVLIDK